MLAFIGAVAATFRGADSMSAYELWSLGDDRPQQETFAMFRLVFPKLWLPSIPLVLLATLAIGRRRMGDVLATLSILAAIAAASAWFVLRDALVQISNLFGPFELDFGTHVLLAGGSLGVIGGCAAILLPEPRAVRRVATSSSLRQCAPKWFVLAGGVLALIGFFLPFVTTTDGTQSISAFELLPGNNTGAGSSISFLTPVFREIVPIKFWLPAIALVALAAMSVARRRMGAVNATLSMLAAIASVSAWFMLRGWMVDVDRIFFSPDEPVIAIGLGAHALLAGGLLGGIGACAAILRPEPAA